MDVIAHISTDFPQKFGIPRQSGIVQEAKGAIIFEPSFASVDAVRGLDGFSHIWLLWLFEEIDPASIKPLVRPPLLGGSRRVGVFATRSPFRPNGIGLSSVKLEYIEYTEKGPVLHVRGADLRDMTPIIDIKPYLPRTDSHPDASAGFTDENPWPCVTVEISDELASRIPDELRDALYATLREDPRPARHDNPDKRYTMAYGNLDVEFTVDGKGGILRVIDILARDEDERGRRP